MALQKPMFDTAGIGQLADQLKKKIEQVEQLKKDYEESHRLLRQAETELANIRATFTRAVDGQLDMSVLNQQPIKSYPVPETP